jgi:DNA-binding response OmpR family regulator
LTKVKEALEQHRQRKRILVVDDDADIRSTLGKLLAMAGHEVLLAENGSEAKRLWREVGADLVIVDLLMPEKDGLETIIELRAHSPGIPIIAMSGGGTTKRMDLLPEAKLLGATVTINKPFSPADMVATVDSVLKDSRPREA